MTALGHPGSLGFEVGSAFFQDTILRIEGNVFFGLFVIKIT
jgi:hypothetical protein